MRSSARTSRAYRPDGRARGPSRDLPVVRGSDLDLLSPGGSGSGLAAVGYPPHVNTAHTTFIA